MQHPPLLWRGGLPGCPSVLLVPDQQCEPVMSLRLRHSTELPVRLEEFARGITDRYRAFKDRPMFSTQQDIVGLMVATTDPQNGVKNVGCGFFSIGLEPPHQLWIEHLRPGGRTSLATQLCQMRDDILRSR